MSDERESPFDVLGVAPTASIADVKQAYHRLLRSHGPEADAQGFQRIRAAYEVATELARTRALLAERAVRGGAVPVEAMSVDAVPLDVVPLDVAPLDVAPLDVAPDGSAPPRSAEDDGLPPLFAERLSGGPLEQLDPETRARFIDAATVREPGDYPRVVAALERACETMPALGPPVEIALDMVLALGATGDWSAAHRVRAALEAWFERRPEDRRRVTEVNLRLPVVDDLLAASAQLASADATALACAVLETGVPAAEASFCSWLRRDTRAALQFADWAGANLAVLGAPIAELVRGHYQAHHTARPARAAPNTDQPAPAQSGLEGQGGWTVLVVVAVLLALVRALSGGSTPQPAPPRLPGGAPLSSPLAPPSSRPLPSYPPLPYPPQAYPGQPPSPQPPPPSPYAPQGAPSR